VLAARGRHPDGAEVQEHALGALLGWSDAAVQKQSKAAGGKAAIKTTMQAQCYRQRQSLAAAAVGEAVAGGRGAAGRALWGAWSKFREAAERELTQAQHEHPPARRRVHGFARAGGAAVRSSREASGVPQPLLSVPDWRRTDARTRHGC